MQLIKELYIHFALLCKALCSAQHVWDKSRNWEYLPNKSAAWLSPCTCTNTPITSIRHLLPWLQPPLRCPSACLSTRLFAYFQPVSLYLWLAACLDTWARLFMQIWFGVICVLVLPARMLLCPYLTFWRSSLPLLCLAAPPTTPSLAAVDV